jgi:hypothetical protein
MKQIFQTSAGKLLLTSIAVAFIISSCNKNNDYNEPKPPVVPAPQSTVVSASGDLNNALSQFRSLLGDVLNSTTNQTSGRREINWDGVPPNFTNANNFPFDFFNSTDPAIAAGRKRGLIYTNTGTSFRVDSTDFSELDPTYINQFEAFSGKRIFAYMANNVSIVSFKVAGTNTDAFVKGFGLVFSDIDNANSTTLEFFNGSKSLGVFKAPVKDASNSFSFLGVHFANEKITSVKITAGNGILGAGLKDISDGGSKDLVVMDDFFYSEPLANQ